MKRSIIVILIISLMVIGITAVQAADYPTKPITVVYHSSAGSGGDIFLRNLGKALEPVFGQPLVVENRVGGGGANAWTYVKKAKADGYTLIGISSTIVAGPLQTPMDVDYTDFKPIAQVFFDPTVIFTSTKSDYDSFEEVMEFAQNNPNKQTWGSGSAGSAETLCLTKIADLAGMEINNVPFEGGGDVVTNIIAGRIDCGIGEYGEISSQVEAGNLKILACLNTERMPDLPEVPTLKELGIDFVFEKIRGVMAPAGTPDSVIQIWNDAIKKVYDDPGFKQYYTNNNIYPLYRGQEDMQKALDDQRAFFKEMSESLK